ncbi:MAG: arylamine N-acetyltransferase [Deltaproteobacteria bacterium]|jgi:arylamine N-acetyltransferase|nr:arylamine N-acetyltransferase [Deltaproteobacteria bacterium]
MIDESYSDTVKDFLKLIGVRPNRPDLKWLTLLAKSFHRMPYENLTKIIRLHEIADPALRPRMPEVVIADHLDLGAGGTCFSLTYFFEQILSEVGYKLYTVLCDRSYGPDTHCALIVEVDDSKYLVDPGYLMEAPLIVPPFGSSVQNGKSSVVALSRLGGTSQLLLSTKSAGRSRLRYRLKDEPVSKDLFFEKWIDSFSWSMMRHMSASIQTEGGLLFMRDGELRRNTTDSKSQRVIKSHLNDEVEATFGIKGRLVSDADDCLKIVKAAYEKKR